MDGAAIGRRDTGRIRQLREVEPGESCGCKKEFDQLGVLARLCSAVFAAGARKMTIWLSVGTSSPAEQGWYPTLSDWRTASLHQSSKHWLGDKWAGTSDHLQAFCPERFDCPHQAAGRAFDVAVVSGDRANSKVAATPAPLAMAAG